MDFEKIKRYAGGRCLEIITALTPITDDIGTAKDDISCPLCGHGSLHADKRDEGVNDHGRLRCHRCCPKGTGDIIDTVKTFGSHESQSKAAEAIANYLGIATSDKAPEPPGIVELVAKAKRMPLDAFRQFGAKAAQRGRDRKPVARVPVYNEDGQIFSHFDITAKDKGFFKRGEGNSGMFFPGKLPQPGETWLLVEGCKDASALVGMGYNAAGLPFNYLPPKYARLFESVIVITVADLDGPGQIGASKTGGHLVGIAAVVKAARLPGEVVATKGDDVRDAIRMHGEKAVRDAIESAPYWAPRDEQKQSEGRPEVVLTLAHAWVGKQIIRHLGKLGWDTPWIPRDDWEQKKVYQRGGVLVDVVTETRPDAEAKGSHVKIAVGTPRIRSLPIQQLPFRIADACQTVQEKVDKEGNVETVAADPSKKVVDGIFTLGDYGREVRHLTGIVTAPTIRPDGSILQKPGWDASGLLYRPTMEFDPIPDQPTQSDAWEACETLFEAVRDFPFFDEADRSAWLAMVLTMIGRPCIPGHTPMFAATANIRASGKSLLVDTASIIAYGHGAARSPYVTDDNEMRKRVTSIVMEGTPCVLLDNIDRPIGGATLDAVLTAERWKDRELGSSRMIDLPSRAVWTATGNNLRFRSDIARRVVPIRLDSPHERPEQRTDFAHDNLLEWAHQHRGELVKAALTILRAYFVAGCPKQKGGQFGSFESWAAIIRGAVVWAGCADPMDTIETAQADDDSAAVVAGLIGGLIEVTDNNDGLTCRQIIDKLNDPSFVYSFPTMREVVAEVATRNGKPDATRLGYALRTYRGRSCNGYRIEQIEGRARQRRWVALPVPKSGDDDSNGDDQKTHRHHDRHHPEPRDLPSEVRTGDDGDDGFSSSHIENSEYSHSNGNATYTNLNIKGGDVSSPSSPNGDRNGFEPANNGVFRGDDSKSSSSPSSSPPRKIPCPKCGATLVPATPVGGYQNFDCPTPGCGHVKPVRVEEAAAR